VAGAARRVFGLLAARRLSGPVLWFAPRGGAERLAGDGMAAFLEPGRLILGEGRGAPELLWAAEEALRTGTAPLVVAELPAPPGLTPVRRLHLAAVAGAGRGAAPIMLLLTPEAGGAPGVETRWRIDPAPGWARDGLPHWRLLRSRARMAPAAAWELRFAGGALAAVPAPGGAPEG
jgi:protein ImuA